MITCCTERRDTGPKNLRQTRCKSVPASSTRQKETPVSMPGRGGPGGRVLPTVPTTEAAHKMTSSRLFGNINSQPCSNHTHTHTLPRSSCGGTPLTAEGSYGECHSCPRLGMVAQKRCRAHPFHGIEVIKDKGGREPMSGRPKL
jgi:hypothetical protein